VTGMEELPSTQVMCFGCRKWRARAACAEVGGLLYGPECAENARAVAIWWCELCGCKFPEEEMAAVNVCKLCEAGL